MKESRRAFVLDIGSASVRLIIGELSDNRVEPEIVFNRGVVTRLREDLNSGAGLSGPRTRDTLAAVSNLFSEADSLLPGTGSCLCTQAVRQAREKRDFLGLLESLTGVSPEILSGQREGELAWHGSKDLMEKEGVLVDLGGGSTEFIWNDCSGSIHVVSVPVASATAKQKQINESEDFWISTISKMALPENAEVVLLGGTATTYAAMFRKVTRYIPGKLHGTKLPARYLKEQSMLLNTMTSRGRLNIPGMEPGREDIIVTGGFHLWNICSYIGVSQVTISEKGIRFGRLIELLSGTGCGA